MAAPVTVGSYYPCPHCQGRGVIRSVETQALAHLRQIQTGLSRRQTKRVQCLLPLEVAQYILNRKRADLLEMEQAHRVEITITAEPGLPPSESRVDFLKE
jgi:ribonuclease E